MSTGLELNRLSQNQASLQLRQEFDRFTLDLLVNVY